MSDYKNLLKEAFEEIKSEELSSVPDENNIEYDFSDKFNKRMDSLLKSQKKNRTLAYRIGKKIAIIILVVLICAISATTVKTDAFHKIFDFFYKIYESVLITSSDKQDNESDYDLIIYTIPEVPNGYESSPAHIAEITFDFMWKHPSGRYIYMKGSKKGTTNTKHQTEDVEIIKINNIDVLCNFYTDTIQCFWEDSLQEYQLFYPDELGLEFAKKTIGNLIIYEE